MACPVCGPKCSICGVILSVWGAVMLAIMGIFFRVHSVALFDDLPLNETLWKQRNYSMTYVYEQYDQVSSNCFIAAGLYVALLVFSITQQRMNARANYILQ